MLATAVASAIPIKARKTMQEQHTIFPPASVPLPPLDRARRSEFDYVPRHVRKTSVDDRRVRVPQLVSRRCVELTVV